MTKLDDEFVRLQLLDSSGRRWRAFLFAVVAIGVGVFFLLLAVMQ
jgi:hypothetical protein